MKRDLEYQVQKATQDLELSRFLGFTGIGILIFLIFCIGLAAIIFAMLRGRNRLVSFHRQFSQTDQWKDLVWRRQQIVRSRQEERMQRFIFLHNPI
jgi:hypothetical protein